MLSFYDLFQLCLNARYLDVKNDASFAVQTRENTLYILFQHSSGLTDWQNNLDFPAAPYRDMETDWRCHRGFLRVWHSILPYIEEILNPGSCSAVTIAGYSHGAALAVLCHEYIWFHYPMLRSSLYGVGFGAPRVVWCRSGCRRIASRWENFTVIRNLDDAVTHLPPSILGYRHMGTLLKIGKKGRYTPIDAHRPESYLASLAEAQGITDTVFPDPL